MKKGQQSLEETKSSAPSKKTQEAKKQETKADTKQQESMPMTDLQKKVFQFQEEKRQQLEREREQEREQKRRIRIQQKKNQYDDIRKKMEREEFTIDGGKINLLQKKYGDIYAPLEKNKNKSFYQKLQGDLELHYAYASTTIDTRLDLTDQELNDGVIKDRRNGLNNIFKKYNTGKKISELAEETRKALEDQEELDIVETIPDVDTTGSVFDPDETFYTTRAGQISTSILGQDFSDYQDKIIQMASTQNNMTTEQIQQFRNQIANLNRILDSRTENIDLSNLSGNQRTITVNVQEEIQKLAKDISRQSGNLATQKDLKLTSKNAPFKKIIKLQKKEQTQFKPTLNQLFQTRKVMC